MKLLKAGRNLRGSILATFSVLLFVSFMVVGTSFNLVVNRYIYSSAIATLDDARADHYRALNMSPPNYSPPLRPTGNTRNLLRANRRSFIIDDNYLLLVPYPSVSAFTIANILKEENIEPSRAHDLRFRSQDYSYFITSASLPGAGNRSTIFYVDVTDLMHFSRTINALLLSLAGLIWLLAVAVSGFLAGYLSRPLHILREFAKRIGQGDFTPNPVSFTNEEFETLNQSLNHTAKQLAKYDNDQKTFFQNVSHELRTPLMIIESHAEGIKYGLMDPAKATQTILNASERLSDMVGDILYISRIDNITLPVMERIDLRILVQERIGLVRPLAELKEIKLEYKSAQEPVMLNCAASYLGRAVDNLLSNAVRFADKHIMVECKSSGIYAVISVTDDGPGFEPEVLPQVFERFFKGKKGLSGIGLSVVRSIVEQHKGTASVRNNNPGSVLTISLPQY